MTTEVSSPPARIVVGVDGSSDSVEALQWAARFAASSGAEIDAVTSWQYPLNFGTVAIPGGWEPAEDAAKVSARAIVEAFGTNPPAGLRVDVLEGHPAQVLIDSSKDAAMLVVGSRGHGGLVGLLLGSVSARCAERAHCPVVVMHSQDSSNNG